MMLNAYASNAFSMAELGASMETMNKRVRAVFVGTHSRKIEGQLLELFHSNG
jgi:hypothetical protein